MTWELNREMGSEDRQVNNVQGCCHVMTEQMQLCRHAQPDPLDSPEDFLVWNPALDEYGIPVRDGTGSIRLISYCPWCGGRLPASKRKQWFAELAKLGIDDPATQDAPEEFRTDRWWRSRGI